LARVNHAKTLHLVIEAARTITNTDKIPQFLFERTAREGTGELMGLCGREKTRHRDCSTSG
jgi:hypothetical protein